MPLLLIALVGLSAFLGIAALLLLAELIEDRQEKRLPRPSRINELPVSPAKRAA